MFMVKTRRGGARFFVTQEEMETWAKACKEIEARMLWGAIGNKQVGVNKRIRRKMKKHENGSRV